MTDLDLKQEILTRLELTDLAPADQDKILAQLEENILAELHLAIIEQLAENERTKLADLDDQAAEQFFRDHLNPDLIKTVATKVVEDFKTRIKQ
jgi:hypothetical protein